MTHHTKTLGDLGVLKAQVDLYQQGWLVCNPLTEHAPFDLVIWKEGVFKTVQVKSRHVRDGKVEIHFSSTYSDSNGLHSMPVDKSKIDLYCIYCPDDDNCYYFDPKKFDKTATFRYTEPKNNQVKGINLLSEYRFIK